MPFGRTFTNFTFGATFIVVEFFPFVQFVLQLFLYSLISRGEMPSTLTVSHKIAANDLHFSLLIRSFMVVPRGRFSEEYGQYEHRRTPPPATGVNPVIPGSSRSAPQGRRVTQGRGPLQTDPRCRPRSCCRLASSWRHQLSGWEK